MHAEAGLQLPLGFSDGFFHDYSSGHSSYVPFSDEGFLSPRFCVGVEDGSRNMALSVLEYDMGGEGDLFNAPEPILEDPALDPMVNAMSIISGGHVITETIKAADIESTQNDHLSDIYNECKKDLMGKSDTEETISDLLEVKILLAEMVEVPPPSKKINCAEGTILDKSQIEETISELLEVKIPAFETVEVPPPEEANCEEILIHKSASSDCLSSLEWIPSSTRRPEFLDFQGLDFEAALGLKRACSEGDIENLGSKSANSRNTTTACSSFEQLLSIDKTEQRLQKLSRYREKKSKRNFARQIKYACRKALADNQPRIRGRFAKTE
ncbi:uncharacterized protein LOC121998770 isoform X2 [Zingiber officinale]|uniref:uncharacterized protein LOC121998770 isoform X2 n=1 Tax=Zingiber officinale TaxID=94328 RepID=UPI001C4C1C16|nr:uncharacterized protein LOC121998770 isoform X2 [Zingiber officinale]